MTAQLPTSRGKNRTITPTNMSDGQSHTFKEPSKGFLKAPKNWFKKTFSSRSTSPHPADGQEIRGGELSSIQRASVSSGHQWIDPIIGASAALSQQGIFYASCSPGSSAQPSMQIIPFCPSYQDRSHLLQVQLYLDLQWLTVRDFEGV